MAIATRAILLTGAIAGGLTTSQAPEFSVQYKQRIGGALDELQIIIKDFDADAIKNGLDRESALAKYQESPEKFLHDRGQSMKKAITRFDSLNEQNLKFSTLSPAARPIALLSNYDPELLNGTWQDFEPGVPSTSHGFLWSLLGAVIGWGFCSTILKLFFRRRNKNRAQGAAA